MKKKREFAVAIKPRKTLAPSGLVALAVAGVTLIVYAWIVSHGAILNYDDIRNLVDNPNLRGLDWPTIHWAATSSAAAGNYEPLYWLIAAAEREFFGLNPRELHFVGAALHAANGAVVYAIGVRLFDIAFTEKAERRSDWIHACAAAGALLFTLHPLRVECAAWLSARHYCLAGLFAFLAIERYIRYATTPPPNRRPVYLWSFCFFALSLLSIPIAIALPLGFILLDIFPLRRAIDRTLLLEKIPFFGLSAAIALTATLARSTAGVIAPLQSFTVFDRLTLFVYSFVFYPAKTLLPVTMVPVYLISPGPVMYAEIAAGIVLVIVGVRAARRIGDNSFVSALGWHLVMILPVSGLVQTGLSLVADRYSYLSGASWGVFAGGWLFYALILLDEHPALRRAIEGTVLGILGLLAIKAEQQTHYWGDPISLWRHELAVYPNSPLALQWMGSVLRRSGHSAEAADLDQKALQLDPGMKDAKEELGHIALDKGQLDEAIALFREAAAQRPSAPLLVELGTALARKGDVEEAIKQFRAAVLLDGRSSEAHFDLGEALEGRGQSAEALAQYEESARLDPRSIPVRQKLGHLLTQRRDLPAAERCYRELLALEPGSAQVHNDMGVVLAMQGRLAEAVPHFQEAVRLDPANAGFRANLLRAAGPR